MKKKFSTEMFSNAFRATTDGPNGQELSLSQKQSHNMTQQRTEWRWSLRLVLQAITLEIPPKLIMVDNVDSYIKLLDKIFLSGILRSFMPKSIFKEDNAVSHSAKQIISHFAKKGFKDNKLME